MYVVYQQDYLHVELPLSCDYAIYFKFNVLFTIGKGTQLP